MTPAELRFHWYRLGSRSRVARLFQVDEKRLAVRMPFGTLDAFALGRMFSIGGILAKRCNGCGTARELERFQADEDRASGCRAVCDSCRKTSLN